MSRIDDPNEQDPPGSSERLAPAPPLHVVLVEPEIAANTGSVGRTCVAIGAMLWLVRPLGFHVNDKNIRRAGLDYWEHLNWRVVDHFDDVASELGHDRLWLFSTKADQIYTDIDYRPCDALVFGPESRGLPVSWLTARPDRAVRIPIHPEARSLNLSNAVAVAAFEAMRQFSAGR
jgi:tRNA (cytidine/uridine-2'-O-)-methyltransferase